jgi:hypothetical protein
MRGISYVKTCNVFLFVAHQETKTRVWNVGCNFWTVKRCAVLNGLWWRGAWDSWPSSTTHTSKRQQSDKRIRRARGRAVGRRENNRRFMSPLTCKKQLPCAYVALIVLKYEICYALIANYFTQTMDGVLLWKSISFLSYLLFQFLCIGLHGIRQLL